jgi:hypothetical protein
MIKSVVIENFFSNDELIYFKSQLGNIEVHHKKTSEVQWFDKNQPHEYYALTSKLIDVAKQFYNLTDYIGYEFWTQHNSRPNGWHHDKDESYHANTSKLKFPICSIVYYLIVENLKGGKLHLEKDIITPEENKLIIFAPGVEHYVEEFEGNRCSVLINPWAEPLHKNTIVSE